MNTHKILALTGVTGKKSGKVLVDYLSNNINEVNNRFPDGIKALTRDKSNTDYILNKLPNIKICRGDFSDDKFLEESLKDVDTLIHIASIRLSSKLIDACVINKVRRVILVHTTGVYSKYKEASYEYSLIDKYVTDTCKNNNIILTILRPTMIYGNIYDNNVIKFIKMVDKLPIMPVVNKAMYKLQPVNYKDLGKAYYDVLMNEETTANKSFNLSGKEPIYLRDMLKEIGKNLGKEVKFINCPYIIAYIGSWIIYLITLTKKDYREKVQRLCEDRIFSHEEATIAFNYNPMSFEDGIKEEIKMYIQNK